MPIEIELDVMMAKRKVTGVELARAIGITAQNVSVLRRGHARAIRFSTLEAICEYLDCQPGDLFSYREENEEFDRPARPPRRRKRR